MDGASKSCAVRQKGQPEGADGGAFAARDDDEFEMDSGTTGDAQLDECVQTSRCRADAHLPFLATFPTLLKRNGRVLRPAFAPIIQPGH